MPKPKSAGLPSRKQILDFIETTPTAVGKREIARAFGLHGAEKIALKALLKDMGDEGLIDSAPGRAFHKMGGIPRVTVLRVSDVDESGIAWAVPERWEASGPEPRLRVQERGRKGALGVGDRILARTEEAGRGWIAHPMKKLARGSELMLGVLREEGGKYWLQGVEKKERRDFLVSDCGEAGAGDLVLAEKAGRPPRVTARVTQRLGDPFEPRSFSLIAIHKLGIPNVFPEAAIDEAVTVARLELGAREDLRHLPIVAIDPADARDHDDAVWAAPRDDGGWDAIVAIADVSYYVRPGSAIDREAKKRGNSVYFPDRVVPMLPETLSAGICSLKAGEDRAAMACHLTISAQGAITAWRFSRAVVRLAANIAYEDAQAAIDGKGGPAAALLDAALKPLWGCWAALGRARDKRAPLDLDLPERRILLDEKGRILSVAPRERLDAHKLIEDYMIAANVAAAKGLEGRKAPVMYRVHEPPSREKLVALKDYLKSFELEFALGQVIRPATFNRVIERVGDADYRPQVMEQILRTQTQAYYAPLNQGHFGLALGSYAHFTSPIRRYADLLVHRALVGAYGLDLGKPRLTGGGKAGDIAESTALTEKEAASMEALGELISQAERRAMMAERDTVDRYVAAYLSEHVGQVVETRITGVQNFGFFATVEGLGGDGLVPVSMLGPEYFRYEEASHSLTGEDSETRYTIGQRLPLRLVEADPVTGALRFDLVDGPGGAPAERRRRPGAGRPIKRRGRPANIRHKSR
ncbi:MAG: ribonuclease R [Sphingomonas sp. SCN 67-18]|uniref:ribonuclease R family protein n=1 Tax=uncultured Sphingomonas sp. TaxID=158754 RepID=UPI000868CB61|nr:VacB/RNase II family 3'-5' exoribonuclease [Sphingomonas sp. SCN 67-18]ODU19920.1 MAG: ribonuclease R [Sphingomonas sp. SCN 67-18]